MICWYVQEVRLVMRDKGIENGQKDADARKILGESRSEMATTVVYIFLHSFSS
jgi:hypothetical protein